MFIFRCVSHSVQRNLRDYITLKTIRKLNIHILSSNSTGYIESFLNDSQIEGENLRFCQGIPHDVLRLRWTERMFIRCLTAQCEEIYRLFCYFAQGGNSYISSLVTALTVRCEVWGIPSLPHPRPHTRPSEARRASGFIFLLRLSDWHQWQVAAVQQCNDYLLWRPSFPVVHKKRHSPFMTELG